MTIAIITTILNIIGLICDMVGVCGLFKSISKGIKPIRKISFGSFHGFLRHGTANLEQDAIVKLQDEINDIIEINNTENKQVHSKSKKWLYFIIFGFSLQVLSYLISLVTQIFISCS